MSQKNTLSTSIYISGVEISPGKSIKFSCQMFPALQFFQFSSSGTWAGNFFGDARWGEGGSRGWKKAGGWLPAPNWAGPPPSGGGVGSALRKALPARPTDRPTAYPPSRLPALRPARPPPPLASGVRSRRGWHGRPGTPWRSLRTGCLQGPLVRRPGGGCTGRDQLKVGNTFPSQNLSRVLLFTFLNEFLYRRGRSLDYTHTLALTPDGRGSLVRYPSHRRDPGPAIARTGIQNCSWRDQRTQQATTQCRAPGVRVGGYHRRSKECFQS